MSESSAQREITGREQGTKAEVVLVLDRSGSMASIWDDCVGGLEVFLDEQKHAEGKANMTLVAFDNEYDVVYDGLDVNDVPSQLPDHIKPRGGTALNDAIAHAVGSLEERIAKMQDKPSVVVLAIVTDGQENQSKEISSDALKALIKKKEGEDWQFVYLASNQIAENVAQRAYGLRSASAMTYDATAKGQAMAFAGLSNAVSRTRSCIAKGGGSSEIIGSAEEWHPTSAEGEAFTQKIVENKAKKKEEPKE